MTKVPKMAAEMFMADGVVAGAEVVVVDVVVVEVVEVAIAGSPHL